jgi:large subunit ribosomal protein L3
MTLGLVGQKIGMTRVYSDGGDALPVSVVFVDPNRITQVKSIDSDGYQAVQVTTGHKKTSRLNKAQLGHFAKAKVEPGVNLCEFRLDKSCQDLGLSVGGDLTVKLFENVSHVDVVGTSKGKGFSGVIKRHNFSSQDATHGNSVSHNVPGSIGQRQSPGKVFKGKKMAGQMGNKRVTAQNLKIVKIDPEKNLILISGGIPGAINGKVIIFPAVKKKQNDKNQGDKK